MNRIFNLFYIFWGLLFLLYPKEGFGQQVEEKDEIIYPKINSWSEPTLIPATNDEGQVPMLPQAVAKQDTLYLVYVIKEEEQTDYGHLYLPKEIYFMQYQNSNWTKPVNVSRSSVASNRPHLAIEEVDENTKLHLFWGEQRMPLAQLDGPPRPAAPDAISYASFKGRNWSNPINLYQAHRRTLGLSSQLFGKDRLHFVFTAPDPKNNKNRIYYIQKQDTIWSTPQIVGTGTEADLARLNDGKMLLAYMRADSSWARRNRSRDINSVFVKTSSDGGLTWGDDMLVHRSRLNPSYSPQLVEDAKGRMHLFWRQDTDGNQYPDLISHTYSKDGEQWKKREILADAAKDIYPDPSYPYYFEIAGTSDGKVYVVFCMGGVGLKVNKLFFTYWDNNGWKTPEPLFDFEMVTSVDLVYDKTENQLYLLFSAGEKGETKLYHSRYQLP